MVAMGDNTSQAPYKALGSRLRQMREKCHESLAETSGAVEIDTEQLVHYEGGEHRPSEDILLLLISHFGVKEDQALALWQLAGYDQVKTPKQHTLNSESNTEEKVVLAHVDQRIVYTDTVHVVVNSYGVVINFMQHAGKHDQTTMISRVGMSKDHARSVLEVLQKTLDAADAPVQQKQLPESTSEVT